MLPRIHLNLERWKFNKELGIYVSSLGNFKTKDKEPIKLFTTSKNRYLRIRIDGKFYAAHRVVLSTFKPVKDDSLTVDHLDHNPRNNALKNLEWVTKQENLKRAERDLVEMVLKREQGCVKKPTKASPNKQTFTNATKGKCVCFGEHSTRTCTAAARIILTEKELPCTERDIQYVASEIGKIIDKNKTLYGYKFERKVL